MRLLLQGHLDLPQRVTLDVVLKDLHPAEMVQHAVYAMSATLTGTECSIVTQKCHLGHMPIVTRRPREAATRDQVYFRKCRQ